MKFRRLVFFSCLLMAILGLQVAPVALLAKSKPKAPAPRQGAPDFSRLVVIGASISAGFQSNAFFQSGQVASYPNLLAKQAGTQIVLPLISDPGIPPNGQLQLTKPVCAAKVGDSAAIQGFGQRANPTQQATLLSVPGHKLLDVLSTRPTTLDPAKITITDFVLGLPGLLAPTPIAFSQMEWVAALKPTTLLVAEVGGNDALGAVLTGTDASLTPLADFRTRYTEIMTKAKASGASTIVTLNIPDLTSFAVVFSQDDISRNFGINKETLQFVFGVKKKDYVTLPGLPLLARGQKLPPEVVLTKKEVKNIQKRIVEYNAVIKEQSTAAGAILVDVDAEFKKVVKDGYTVAGVGKLTNKYLGGIFSLDGFHPTATGQAVVCNYYIEAINRARGTTIPLVDVSAIALQDSLVCKAGAAGPVEMPTMTLQEIEKLKPMLDRTWRLMLNSNEPVFAEENQ
ncbi:MAG: hypothetical protein HY774_13705 [Acidobacteria bacterium]|nr:hypothetical protein [Acidobacteriota bacterium]